MAAAELTVETLADVYRAGYPHFLRVSEAITGDVESARDAVHEGFVNAIRRRGTFRGTGPVEGWVWRCVVNAAKHTRRGRRDSWAELPDQPAPPHPDPDDDVTSAIARLPERQRLALFLRYYGDLDYEAIAEALEISSGAVGASLNKAHRRLRSTLREVHVDRS
jgi:RNA polymerase sigma-70 factor (ECF subfamily)